MPKKLRTVTNCLPRREFHSILRLILGIFLVSFGIVSLFSKTGIQTSDFGVPVFLKNSKSSVIRGSLDYSSDSSENQGLRRNENGNGIHMNIAVVVCVSLEYVDTLVKTSLIFSQDVASLNFIFFADEEIMPYLQEYLTELHAEAKYFDLVNVTYELHDIWFPKSKNVSWTDTELECTNQRLFFPSLLPHIDSLIYLDTDVIITGNLSEVWNEFSRMNSDQIIAMAPDFAWTYPGTRKFKKYVNNSGINGVNAGITLMNLTRLRAFDFERKIEKVFLENRKVIKFADQDMMNILFHENPNQIYVLSCIFNFFAPRCTKQMWCEESREQGIVIIHAAGGNFVFDPTLKKIVWKYNDLKINNIPAFFPWIYNVTFAYKLSESPWKLRTQLISEYEEKSSQSCYGNNAEILTRNMEQYLTNLNYFYKSS